MVRAEGGGDLTALAAGSMKSDSHPGRHHMETNSVRIERSRIPQRPPHPVSRSSASADARQYSQK